VSAKVRITTALLTLLTACACGASDDADAPEPLVEPTPAAEGEPWETLDEWHLFQKASEQRPANRVVPYDVISVLFADDAGKQRFLWIPPGTTIGWHDTEHWQFPIGSIAIKTFFFSLDERDPSRGRRLLETRLLIRESAGWQGHTYVWNEAQTEAERVIPGRTLEVSFIDAAGENREQRYEVPNEHHCQECHGVAPDTELLGPRTRQLDRMHDYGSGAENQIDHMAALGLFDVTPPQSRLRFEDPLGDGPIGDRARAYLDANCGHCHSQSAVAASTNFWLDYEHTDPATGNPINWGVCKFPTSAGPAAGGHSYDVVPGRPDDSILIYRMESVEAKVKMPPIPTRRADSAGVALMREWILAMSGAPCD
jgi:uncharacterized repeat protein (TIGR03806 family)